MNKGKQLGAHPTSGNSVAFAVWAPLANQVELHIVCPSDQLVPMQQDDDGYWHAQVEDCSPGTRYFFRLNGSDDRPDPASRLQPEGVHGPSQVCAPAPPETDGWKGLPLQDYIIYELHVGTFTQEGTLEAIVPRLATLKELGITAIELMPLAEFPGDRNWGYDGVFPFAVEHSYGGVPALISLVNECHRHGLAVVLDVVYNHLGPEGNYFRDFGPYFTDRYRTPWGDALNFDGPDSDHVRRYFLENALYWIDTCGVDALRLDAVHAIYDRSANPFLQELANKVHRRASELERQVYLIAESDLNDSRVVRSPEKGGLGLDAQWSDEFHHSLHTLITGETSGYYSDFGSLRQMSTVMSDGWVYSGQYSPHRRVRFGNSPFDVAPQQLVVCSQNHDQIGNRMLGDRLHHTAGMEGAKLAAAAVILSPYIPLLFMGEEYAERAPFQYFVSHSDPVLQEAVSQGRKREFAAFLHQGEPPDPQDERTFLASKLDYGLADAGEHAEMRRWYQELIRLRRTHPALRSLSRQSMNIQCLEKDECLVMQRTSSEGRAAVILHFGRVARKLEIALDGENWKLVLDSHRTADVLGGDRRTGSVVAADLAPFECLVFTSE